jgi:hypothetical protein
VGFEGGGAVTKSAEFTGRGPSLGTYRDRDIPEWINSDSGRFNYDRVAMEDRDGSVPLAQLRPDEFVVAPGLIYRRAGEV